MGHPPCRCAVPVRGHHGEQALTSKTIVQGSGRYHYNRWNVINSLHLKAALVAALVRLPAASANLEGSTWGSLRWRDFALRDPALVR